MYDVTGFFSYAHSDDAYSQLRRLKDALCNEYHGLTGENLELFFDRDSIEWGQKWELEITAGVERSSFFIPVYSPSYFNSDACLREFSQYSEKAKRINAANLILPIMLFPIEADYLNIDQSVLGEALAYQYEDWTDLRFKAPCSEEYQRAIHKMALRLVKANRSLIDIAADGIKHSGAKATVGIDREYSKDDEKEPSEFYLESIGEIQAFFPKLTECIKKQSACIVKVGQIVSDGTSQLNSAHRRGAGVEAAIAVIAGVASRLDDVASEFEPEAEEYANLVNEVNPKVITVLNCLSKNGPSRDGTGMILQLSQFCDTTQHAIDGAASLRDTMSKTQLLSRALYKPMKRLENCLVKFISASDTVVNWRARLDADCC